MNDVVAEMDKGWNEKIVFSVSQFKGKDYANIRIYYEDDEGEWKPTKKGITVSMDSFAEFKEHLEELEAFLKEKGFL
jgi:hypothetical protein